MFSMKINVFRVTFSINDSRTVFANRRFFFTIIDLMMTLRILSYFLTMWSFDTSISFDKSIWKNWILHMFVNTISINSMRIKRRKFYKMKLKRRESRRCVKAKKWNRLFTSTFHEKTVFRYEYFRFDNHEINTRKNFFVFITRIRTKSINKSKQ